MIEIDKRLLIDTVTIKKDTGEKDGWGKVILESPVTLKHVRFDRQYQVQGTKNSRKESKPSTLFVYPKHCPIILDDTFKNAIINDGEREYRVTAISPISYPHKQKVFCYEVECI